MLDESSKPRWEGGEWCWARRTFSRAVSGSGEPPRRGAGIYASPPRGSKRALRSPMKKCNRCAATGQIVKADCGVIELAGEEVIGVAVVGRIEITHGEEGTFFLLEHRQEIPFQLHSGRPGRLVSLAHFTETALGWTQHNHGKTETAHQIQVRAG